MTPRCALLLLLAVAPFAAALPLDEYPAGQTDYGVAETDSYANARDAAAGEDYFPADPAEGDYVYERAPEPLPAIVYFQEAPTLEQAAAGPRPLLGPSKLANKVGEAPLSPRRLPQPPPPPSRLLPALVLLLPSRGEPQRLRALLPPALSADDAEGEGVPQPWPYLQAPFSRGPALPFGNPEEVPEPATEVRPPPPPESDSPPPSEPVPAPAAAAASDESGESDESKSSDEDDSKESNTPSSTTTTVEPPATTLSPPRARRSPGGGANANSNAGSGASSSAKSSASSSSSASGSFSSASASSSSSSDGAPIYFGGPSNAGSSAASQSNAQSGGGVGGYGAPNYSGGFGGGYDNNGAGSAYNPHAAGTGFGSAPHGGGGTGYGGGSGGEGNLLNRFGSLDEPGPASVEHSGTSNGKGVHSSASSSIDSTGKVTYHVQAGKF